MSCFNLYKNAGHTLFILECTSFEGGGGGCRTFRLKPFCLKAISSKGHFV